MTTDQKTGAAAEPSNAPSFQIQRVYVKDCSMELPNAPEIFLDVTAPEIQVSVDVGMKVLEQDVYEVWVVATVEAKVSAKTAFLVEIKEAGIFEIRNIPNEQMGPLLGVACPTIIYPYLRAQIADLISRSGYPPVHLNDVNFDGMYQQRVADLTKAATEKQS